MSSSAAIAAIAAAPANSAPPSIIYLGVDVHKESITVAVLPAAAKTPTRLERLPNDLPKLKRWLTRVAQGGELRALPPTAAFAAALLFAVLPMHAEACIVGQAE